MAGAQRWAVKLAMAVLAIAAVAARPASAGTAATGLPERDRLPPYPGAATTAPPMSPAVDLSATSIDNHEPDVAYNTQFDEYLAVWEGDKAIWGRRVSSRGQPIGNPFSIESGSYYGYRGPRVAYDPQRNRYLVVWGRLVSNQALTMHGRFVPALGPEPGLTAFALDPNESPATAEYTLDYALAQDEFLAAWGRQTGGAFRMATFARRIKADGSGFPAGTFLLAEHTTDNRARPDVAYNLQRNEYLVTVDDYSKVDEDVYGVRLTAGGIVLGGGEFGIAGWPDDELGPAVAACPTGDQYLVAWHSTQVADNTDGIYARFVSGDGSPGTVVQLAHYGHWEWPRPIDGACGVTNDPLAAPRYLVAWAKSVVPQISCLAREVFSTGSMGDEVVITSHCRGLAVAGGTMNHLVVFDQSGTIYARIVGNTRPEAYFTVTPPEGNSTTAFQFDASGCTDATDEPGHLQVRWDWDNDDVYDTTWSATKTASHQFSLADWQSMAVYYVHMQVTDGHGATDETRGEVRVYNAPPSALLAVQPPSGDSTTVFQFDATGSSDPEGGALQVRWDWDDDAVYDTPWSATMTASHQFSLADWQSMAVFHVQMQVRDGFGLTSETSAEVRVYNAPPSALLAVQPPSGDTTTVFKFDATGSDDPEGGALQARWDWEDDGAYDTAWGEIWQPEITFPTPGTHTVRVQVRDNYQSTASATRTVYVGQPGASHWLYLPLTSRQFP